MNSLNCLSYMNQIKNNKITKTNKSTNYASYPNLKPLMADTVNFCANKKDDVLTEMKLEKSPNAKSGNYIGKKLILLQDLNIKNIENTFSASAPVPIQVLNINTERPANIQLPPNTIAHMLPMYSNNLELNNAVIFLNPEFLSEKEKNTLIADSAHEYTHVIQRANDKNYYGFSDDLDSISDITNCARLSQQILNEIVRTCSDEISSNPVIQNSFQNGKYQFSIKEIEQVCSKKEALSLKIEGIINALVNYSINNGLDIEPETVIKCAKSFIKQEALNEAEAYTVTLNTLKKSQNFDKYTYAKRNLNQCIYSAIYNAI